MFFQIRLQHVTFLSKPFFRAFLRRAPAEPRRRHTVRRLAKVHALRLPFDLDPLIGDTVRQKFPKDRRRNANLVKREIRPRSNHHATRTIHAPAEPLPPHESVFSATRVTQYLKHGRDRLLNLRQRLRLVFFLRLGILIARGDDVPISERIYLAFVSHAVPERQDGDVAQLRLVVQVLARQRFRRIVDRLRQFDYAPLFLVGGHE